MADFEKAFEVMIVKEGGYVLHDVPGDRGGMTYAGISRRAWPKWSGWLKIDNNEYDAELTQMVRDFYKHTFWDKIKGDQINSDVVATSVFCFCVNAGLKTGVRLVQSVINATPDGVFGPKTLDTLNNLIIDKKDERIFILTYALMKIERYKNIVMNDDRRKQDVLKSNIKFICGWINRAIGGIV